MQQGISLRRETRHRFLKGSGKEQPAGRKDTMRPERLIISGWGPYKNRTKIDFTAFEGRGLFLVTGATGAGKTTIFDAITYALYGGLSGEMREKNSVRSDFADADTPTFVELFMQHGGNAYHIIRNPEYIRPRKRGKSGAFTKEKENAVLYLPDGKVIEGTREVNAKMQEILVLDYMQFKQITMIAQGEFARLLTASPRDKTRIFRDIFGTGIYERFTQILRTKSNAIYGRVTEQKHKLEEDLRFLLADTHEQEMTKELMELTEKEDWNYAAIWEELSMLYKKAGEKEASLQEVCRLLQKKNDTLTEEVTGKRMENEQIERLEQAKRTLLELKEQADVIEEKRKLLVRARAAELLAPYRIKAQTARQSLDDKKSKEKVLQEDLQRLFAEKQKLSLFAEREEEMKQYLEVCRQLWENREKEKEEEKNYGVICKRWEAFKEEYLKEEKKRDEKKKAYEEADRLFSHAAVGIAAKMLKPGEPCPVCGSLEHPHPAREMAGLPSEEELKRLSKELEEAEATLQKVQEQAVAAKTLATEKGSLLSELHRRTAELIKKEEEEGKALFSGQDFADSKFLSASYAEKASEIQKKTDRLKQAEGILLSTEEQIDKLVCEISVGKQEKTECEKILQEALKKEGFDSEEQCEAACLKKQEMAELEELINAYTEKLTAAKSVKAHLEETLSGKKKHDLEALLEEAEECRKHLGEQQNGLKQAHAFCEEIKKTRIQFQEKQKKIGKAKEEYGFVRDLDNLASGNNTKRLVFEQYVLAGYFEEILRAANLRFLKMTGGRYEMSRVEEAGDGRVKDSLEIQVMDYYTGKPRSVKTLSGGESFKASLSLALGMSDVIQAMNGGIKVDTLFIDEGFGALDTESLDQACETLTGLVEHDRLIGIISHVPELRERIDSQLIIEKTNSGSSVKIHV